MSKREELTPSRGPRLLIFGIVKTWGEWGGTIRDLIHFRRQQRSRGVGLQDLTPSPSPRW